MISKASARFVRISPRKVRYVIDLIRRKSVSDAWAILNGSPRRAGGIVRKLLDQAVDAAKRNSQADVKKLFVSKVTADGGPSMRRFRAASMGRASTIKKRTSHILLELDAKHEAEVTALPKKAARVEAAPSIKKASRPEAKATKKTAHKKLAGV